MANVFLVIGDDVGEYNVLAVCSTSELAEEAAKRTGADTIDEMTLDDMPPLEDGKYRWTARFGINGVLDSISPAGLNDELWPKHGSWKLTNGSGCVRCLAVDEDAAKAEAVSILASLPIMSPPTDFRYGRVFKVTREMIVEDRNMVFWKPTEKTEFENQE